MSDKPKYGRAEHLKIMDLLYEIEELESKSHGKWDQSFTNVTFANPSEESREEYVQQTYDATGHHAEAMEKLREAQRRLKNLSYLDRHPN